MAGGGASALRWLAGGLSMSSAIGDETHFCAAPLPRKTPSGGCLAVPHARLCPAPRGDAAHLDGDLDRCPVTALRIEVDGVGTCSDFSQ
jgi:hypothetical protein